MRPPIGNFVCLGEIAPEPVQWLSPGRLALGKVTILDGDPGLGKSTLLAEFAARLTRGEPLPGGQAAKPRSVVLLAAADSLYDTIRPRLVPPPGGSVARVVWDGESRYTASQLLQASSENPATRTALAEARQWLRPPLAAGPLPSKHLQEAAAAHGHAWRTLARARRAEHITIAKQPGRNGPWTWSLPPANDATNAQDTQPQP